MIPRSPPVGCLLLAGLALAGGWIVAALWVASPGATAVEAGAGAGLAALLPLLGWGGAAALVILALGGAAATVIRALADTVPLPAPPRPTYRGELTTPVDYWFITEEGEISDVQRFP